LGSGAICTMTGCACPAGHNICGACIDLAIDPGNCGQCGKTCLGNETCQNGTCVACPADKPIDCNNTCIDTVNDHSNCGSCGSACVQGSVCSNGSCVPCPANQAANAATDTAVAVLVAIFTVGSTLFTCGP
jgi:hypothetical protein